MQNHKVDGVIWHFFTSPIAGKIGPSEAVLQLLRAAKIGVEFHP